MRANDLGTFNSAGHRGKDNTNEATNRNTLPELRTYLQNLPSLGLSEKGQVNICQRFKVSAEELAATVASLQSTCAPTNELLSIIGAAVTHTNKGKGGPGKW